MASNFDENYVQLLKPENETIQKPFRLNGPYKSISFDDLLSGDTRSYEQNWTDVTTSYDCSDSYIPADQIITEESVEVENTGILERGISKKTGRPKRNRTLFSDDQLLMLEYKYKSRKYCSPKSRRKIAENLNISDRNIKIWFQNRRQRDKRESSIKKIDKFSQKPNSQPSPSGSIPPDTSSTDSSEDASRFLQFCNRTIQETTTACSPMYETCTMPSFDMFMTTPESDMFGGRMEPCGFVQLPSGNVEQMFNFVEFGEQQQGTNACDEYSTENEFDPLPELLFQTVTVPPYLESTDIHARLSSPQDEVIETDLFCL